MDPVYMQSTNKSSDADAPNDFQDLCQSVLSQVLEIEKVSVDTITRCNSCILDSFLSLPELSNFQQAAAQAFVYCTGLQMSWLSLLSPQTITYLAAPSAEVLERSMDIALGLCFTPGSWTTISGDQASSAEELPQNDEAMAASVQVA